MLETELKNLTAEIIKLREAIAAMSTPAVVASVSAPRTEETAPQPAPESAQPQQDLPTVTVDDVLDLCMTLTRKDRTLKDSIKELIAKHGNGASTVKQVPPVNLPALAQALQALQ